MRPSSKSLLYPLLAPALISIWILVDFAAGNVNIHGGTAALLMLGIAAGVAVTLWEVVAVPLAACSLWRNPGARSKLNVVALSAGGIYLFCAASAYEYYLEIQRIGIAHG